MRKAVPREAARRRDNQNPVDALMNQNCAEAAETIADASYVDERYLPQAGQPFYLHLSDLLIGLQKYSTTKAIRVLDFGCGGSPYRKLFPNADYIRADLPGGDNLDFVIQTNNTINAEAESFDLVFSTQVLEHIEHTEQYLGECYRLLKPGGQLVLTTHGIFEEHGCPHDFRRWTADGLRTEIMAIGFEPETVYKLTTGGRALAFLMDRYGGWIRISRRSATGLLFWLLNRTISQNRRQFHRCCDRGLGNSRIVEASAAGPSMYIALLISAFKPRGPKDQLRLQGNIT